MKYVTRPIEVDAIKFMGGHVSALEVGHFIQSRDPLLEYSISGRSVQVPQPMLETPITVYPDDYLIRDTHGNYRSMAAHMFHRFYDPAPGPYDHRDE
jgi:hypothetical protein